MLLHIVLENVQSFHVHLWCIEEINKWGQALSAHYAVSNERQSNDVIQIGSSNENAADAWILWGNSDAVLLYEAVTLFVYFDVDTTYSANLSTPIAAKLVTKST